MTQTAHVAAREAVYQILREALRLGMELRPKMLRSGAALPHERIYESLIPLRKVKELHCRRIALDTAIACAPSTPEPAIRNRISHPIRDISSCTSPRTHRARARRLLRAPALGCADVCGFGTVPADPGRALPYDQPTQNIENRVPRYPRARASHSEQGHSASPRPPRVSGRRSASMNNEHSGPPSQRRRAASRRRLWHNTATSLGANQAVATIVL